MPRIELIENVGLPTTAYIGLSKSGLAADSAIVILENHSLINEYFKNRRCELSISNDYCSMSLQENKILDFNVLNDYPLSCQREAV